MSAEQNLHVSRIVIEEAFNKGNFAVLPDCFHTGYIENQFGLSTTIEGLQNDITSLRRSFPDFHLTIEEMVADGDKVWIRATGRGTNLGGFMGPPDGKSFEVAVFDLLRFKDGRIIEHWGTPDRFALLAQLGLLPQGKQETTA